MPSKHRLFRMVILMMLLQTACTINAAVATATSGANPTAALATATLGLQILENPKDGYRLSYPAGYSTDVPGYIIINRIHAPGDKPGDAWMSIQVEAANGRTAEQAAQTAISAAGPGFNLTTSELTIDGQPAVRVDGLPGPDPLRKVFVVCNDRLYTLIFMPWTQSTSGELSPLENLYTTIVQTLQFLPPR